MKKQAVKDLVTEVKHLTHMIEGKKGFNVMRGLYGPNAIANFAK